MRAALLTILLTTLAVASTDPVLEGFDQRLQQYVKLRQEAAAKVPPIGKKASAAKIHEHQTALATAIQAARSEAKPGDILTSDVKPMFARILASKTQGRPGKKVRATIKEGNPKNEKAPGEVEPVLKVNAIYPKNAPLSSVPPTLLLKLPKLPKDVEYRFVGRTLILRDREADIIIDFMKEAVPLT